jgi:hypothetical protein
MSIRDRRSGIERRGSNRYTVEVEVEWQDSGRRSPGALSDVSLNGCFVLSSGEVNDGDHVKIFVPMGEGKEAEFGGLVANHVLEIGFGLKFDDLSNAQRDVLVTMVRND